MDSLRRRLIAASALAVPLAGRAQQPLADVASQEAKAPPLPAVGTPLALPATIERLDGTHFSAHDAEGRVLVLYWWASWCPFCAETTPHIEALWRAQRALGDKGLLLLALSIDTQPQPARDYLARRGYTLPAAWMTPALRRTLPKPRGLPVTVVRGRDGRVLQAEAGQLFPEDVQALARHA
ncbi:MAG: TlpA family protein disulfide reductase [Aquincola sp.]|nr:TlpA family protein disulfide reductase [Aquincola sp.]MDH5328566.1 TlpA family protein disulfide reductase [Aquincola sp.]